jgi:hypothetical protein
MSDVTYGPRARARQAELARLKTLTHARAIELASSTPHLDVDLAERAHHVATAVTRATTNTDLERALIALVEL